MRRETLLIVVGVLVCSSPFLGVPVAWKSVLLGTCGAVTVLIAVSLRLAARRERPGTPTYTEHDPKERAAP